MIDGGLPEPGLLAHVAPTSQNRVVSTVRGTEVVSDPTNVMARECARRLLRDHERPVRLVTCQRVVRAQLVPDRPGHGMGWRSSSR